MSWPHILSFSRVLAAPVVTALALLRPPAPYLLAALIFGAASITDLLDGQLARHSQRSNTLGVFLDTTADKVLVCVTLAGLAVADLCPAWVALLVIGRESLISGLRSFAASNDRVISAHIWGKGKTAVTMVAIGCVLLAADGRFGGYLAQFASQNFWSLAYQACQWLLALSGLLTLISGARYLVDAWPLFRPRPQLLESSAGDRQRVAVGGDRG